MSNTCTCACSHAVSRCAKKPEHEDAIDECGGAGVAAVTDLPLNSCDRRADTRVDQSAFPVPSCYHEVLEHDSEPDTDDDPEMPGLAHDEQDALVLLQAQKLWLRRATYGVNGAQP